MSAWGMLKQGNVVGFFQRVWETVMGHLPAPVAAFVQKVLADEGNVLISAAEAGAKDVIANGLTTASFTKAAADVAAQVSAQGITVATTDVFAALNLAVGAAQASTSTAPAPVTTPGS